MESASRKPPTAFVNLLLAACESDDGRIYAVITMRSDYLGDCAQIPGLAEAVNRGEYLIPRLSRDQRRDAIERPVGVGGARMAPRLVQHMLNDLGDDPDQLPVLQHALMRTWDAWSAGARDSEPIDLPHYEATGGMDAALSRHADEVFDALPDDEHRRVAEGIFKALTVKGPDNRGIRRPTRLERLAGIVGASEACVKAVVDAYRKPGVTFLMPGSGMEIDPETVIDLSHESLMRVWQRLRGWVEEEAQSARIYRRLAETAALWDNGQAGLYHDPDLQIALAWRLAENPGAAWAEQYGGGFDVAMKFLDASREADHAEEVAREAARQRELEHVKALAEAQRERLESERRAGRRMKTLAAGMAAVAALALAALMIAVVARRQARHNARLAQANAAAATQAAGDAQTAAAALQRTLVASDFTQGVERLDSGDGRDGLGYLARAIRNDPKLWAGGMRVMSALASGRFPLETFEPIEQDKVITFHRLNSKQNLLVTSDVGSGVETPERLVWDAMTGQRLYSVAAGIRRLQLDWSVDGAWLVGLAIDDRTFRVWEARSGREVLSQPIPRPFVESIQQCGDAESGPLVVGQLEDDLLKIWKLPGFEPVADMVQARSPSMDGFGVSRDGRLVYGIYSDATLAVWRAADGSPVGEVSTRPHRVHRDGLVRFSQDGKSVIVRSESGKQVNWWHLGEQNPDAVWFDFEDPVDLHFPPDGGKVALVTHGAQGKPLRIAVHDLRTRQRIASIETQRPQRQLIVTPEIDTSPEYLRFSIMGAVEGNVVRFWDLETGGLTREILTPGLLARADLSPDGRRVLTVSFNHEVMLWDFFTGNPLLGEALKHDGPVSFSFSPDGEKLATNDAEKFGIQLWDTRTGRRLAEPFKASYMTQTLFPGHGERLLSYESIQTSAGSEFSRQTTGRFHLIDLSWRPVLFETLTGPTGNAPMARFTPDGAAIVIAGGNRLDEPEQVSVWDVATRQLRRSMRLPHGVSVVASTLTISPDGTRAAIGCTDGRARIWDVSRGELVHELVHGRSVPQVVISPDGSRIATGTANGQVRVWNMLTGAPLFDPANHGEEPITALFFSHDGTLLASGSRDFKLRVIDAASGVQKFEPIPLDNIVNESAFSLDDRFIAATPFSTDVAIIEVATGKVVRKLPHPDACRNAHFSPDGSILAVGIGGRLNAPVGDVYLWNWREGKTVGRPLHAKGAVDYLDFNADGSLLATGTVFNTGAVQVWDMASGHAVIDPVEDRGGVHASVEFNPAGTHVLAGWRNGTVRLIDLPPRGGKQPGWLPELAEAVAGSRLSEASGGVEEAPREGLEKLRKQFPDAAPADDDPFSAWARWFHSDSAERPISPLSNLSIREYLSRLRRSSNLDDLQKALRLAPADGLTQARIGLVLLDALAAGNPLDANNEADARLRRHWVQTAAWYGRRAVEVEPDNAEAWALEAEILQRLDRKAEAGAAVARAMELDPSRAEGSSPNAAYLKALALASENKWDEADVVFAKAIDGVAAAAKKDERSEDAVPLLGVLTVLEPVRAPAGFRNLHLPPPIPGTFEDFDSSPEGGLPQGWTARHEPLDSPPSLRAERLDASFSNAFADWLVVSFDRAAQFAAPPFYPNRALAQGFSELVNGRVSMMPIRGRYLYSLSANRGTSNVQILVTPAYDCSGRNGVHVAFQSGYEQAGSAIAALEYSVDDGATWLPVLYRVNAVHVVQDTAGKVDAVATLGRPRHPFPLFIDERGQPRGIHLGDYIGTPISRELDPFIEGLRRDLVGRSNRMEVHRLPKADGQAKVRLRFAHAGRDGWYWAVDNFGLHEIPDGKLAEPVEKLDVTRDSIVMSALGAATALGVNVRGGMLGSAESLLQATMTPAATGGADPVASQPVSRTVSTGTRGAGDPRRSLEARLLARRGYALAGGDAENLRIFAIIAPVAGEFELARAALARVGERRAINLQTASALLTSFRRDGETHAREGDSAASVIEFEAAHVLHQALTGTVDREILDRLSQAGLVAETETLVARGAKWRFSDDGRDLGTAWREPDFDDSLWLAGEARFGYGGDGEKTVVSFGSNPRTKFITTHFRAAFEVKEGASFAQLRISAVRDDGMVVYLNGAEVVRDNMPAGEITFTTRARTQVNESENEQRVFVFDVPATSLRPGRNIIAAEVHQQSQTSSDLGFDLELEGVGGLKDSGRSAAEIAAVEERLAIPQDLRSVLWVARAERARLASAHDRATEALDRAASFGEGNPAIQYERALAFEARGDAEAAFTTYRKAVEAVVGLKAGPPTSFALFLPDSLKSSIEPIERLDAHALVDAADRISRSKSASKDAEARWLIRWAEEIEAESPDSRIERARVLVTLGRDAEALVLADAELKSADPNPPPRRVRERKDWLSIRERILRRSGKNEEADAVRDEIFKSPPRNPDLTAKAIDLSQHYNASIYDGRDWHADQHISMLPETFRPRDGIEFDLRGIIQLNSGTYPLGSENISGRNFGTYVDRAYPNAVAGILVGQTVQRLHILSGCVYGRAPLGTEVARLTVRYDDGTTADIPLLEDVDTFDWALIGDLENLDANVVAWIQGQPRRALARKSWANPHPAKPIRSLDFVSSKAAAAPFLVAVTVE